MFHGMGAAQIIESDGTKITMNKALRDLDTPIEEAKCDSGRIYCALHFIDDGLFPESMETEFCTTYLADMFKYLRFGANTTQHGKACVMAYNYLKDDDQGAINYNKKTGRFGINYDCGRKPFLNLSSELLNIQASGSYDEAKEFEKLYGEVPGEINDALIKLECVPLGIYPMFTWAD